VLMILVFMVGEGLPRPGMLTPSEKLGFAVTVAMMLGLILGWRWEGFGGSLALASYFGFAGLGAYQLLTSPFLAGGLAGVFYLLAWLTSDRSEWRAHGGPKRLGFSAAALGGTALLFWVWLGMGARSMEARTRGLPEISGRWTGSSFVSDSRIRNERIDLDIIFLPNGECNGRIGDATVLRCRLSHNLRADRRGYLLSRISEPVYRLTLQLDRPPIITPRRSEPSAYLTFNLQDHQMSGSLHLYDLPEDLRDMHLVLQRGNQ